MKLISKSNKNKRPQTDSNRNAANTNSTVVNGTAAVSRKPAPDRDATGRKPVSGNPTVNAASNATANSRKAANGKNSSAINPAVNDLAEKAAPKKKSPIKTILIIFLVIVVGFAAFFISLGFYVDSLDTIFPNVWADGIKVSGLTFEEAKQTLIAAGYESNADGISATIVFPDDSSFTVTGEQVGLSFDANEAATAAFAFGRDDTFFGNEITYIRSIFNRTELTDLSTPDFTDDIVRQLAAEYTVTFNETLMDNSLEYTDSYITIIKGTGLEAAVEEEVFNFAIFTLMRAIEANDHLTGNYSPEANIDDIIDLPMLFEHIHVDPISSMFDVETFSVTDSSSGRTFDLEDAVDRLRSAEYGSTIVIPIIILEPDYSKEEVEAMLFRDVLAESTTRMQNNSNRVNNISVAARNINEKVINPGEVFSFNEAVGPRRRDTGFLEANVIVGGRLQPGIGGGICQMSSTLYDAILHTHLEVVERRPHSLTISYMPDREQGRDATVAFGQQDFKFKNNTGFPIKIETEISGLDVTARIIGTKLDDTFIELEVVELSRTPVHSRTVETDELLVGETDIWTPGQEGVRVEVFQNHMTAEGVLIEQIRVGISTYGMQERITRVGIREPEYEPAPPPQYDDHETPNDHEIHDAGDE